MKRILLKKRLAAVLVVAMLIITSIPTVVAFSYESVSYDEANYIERIVDEPSYDEFEEKYPTSAFISIQPLSSVIVSTQAELRAAITGAPANTPIIITVNNTINITGSTIAVSGARNITINGTGTLTVSSNIRHFAVSGATTTLTLAGDITLTRAAGYTSNGGGIFVSGGWGNNRVRANLIMRENAAIINNQAGERGGGVALDGAAVSLYDNSRIENNHAGTGGGVAADAGERCGVIMWDNSSISYNTATNGGGIIFGALDDLEMHGGRINGNTANNGGGMYSGGGTTHLQMFAGEIRNNTAANNGGAINIGTDWGSLSIQENMIFNGNTAGTSHDFGLETGLGVWSAIRWAGNNSIPGTHLLNNYDINFTGQTVTIRTVTFDGNGGTVLPVNQTRNVVSGHGLGAAMPPAPTHPQGAAFLGWTRNQDGTGGAFTATTTITANITVYAQWGPIPDLTITFDGNEGIVLPANETRNVAHGGELGGNMPPDPTHPQGAAFLGWTINQDGTGGSFTATTTATASITVYAQWTPVVPLMITKAADRDTASAGDIINYTITMSNDTDTPIGSATEPLIFLDVLDPRVTFVPSSTTSPSAVSVTFIPSYTTTPSAVSVTLVPSSATTPSAISITLSMEYSNGEIQGDFYLPANSKIVITFSVVVNANVVGGVIRNSAIISFPHDPYRHDIMSNEVIITVLDAPIIPPYQPPPPPPPSTFMPPLPPPSPRPTQPPVVDDPAPEVEYYEEEPPVDPTPVLYTHYAYMIGFEDGTVRPQANITRAEATTIFFRLISDTHRSGIWSRSNSFSDVEFTSWYNTAISTMDNGGFVAGYPDGSFRPNQSITRAEMTALVVRFMGYGHLTNVQGGTFSDTQGHWAQDAINTASRRGWVTGFEDGTFRPDQPITRAEAAALINRMLGRLPQNSDDLLAGMLTWPDNMNVNAWYYLYIQEATNSHYHVMNADGIHETWTQLIAPRDWRALELSSSAPSN